MGERPFSDVLIKLQLKTDIISLGHWGVAFSSVIVPFPVMLGSACVPAPPPRVEFSFFPLFPCTSFSEFPPVPSDCFLGVLMLNIFFLREMSEMEFQQWLLFSTPSQHHKETFSLIVPGSP